MWSRSSAGSLRSLEFCCTIELLVGTALALNGGAIGGPGPEKSSMTSWWWLLREVGIVSWSNSGENMKKFKKYVN